MFLTEELEMCEWCRETVHIDQQYLGLCHSCIDLLELISCAGCGDLMKWRGPFAECRFCTKCISHNRRIKYA